MSSHYVTRSYEESDSPPQNDALTPSHALESSSGSARSSGQGTIIEGTNSDYARDMDATLRRGQGNPTEHGQLSASSSADDNLLYQSQEATESSDHIGHLAEPSDSTLYNHPNTSSTSAAPPSSWVARLTGRNRSSSVDSPPSSHFTFPSRLRTTTANADVGLPHSVHYGSPHQSSPGGTLASPGRPQIVVSPSPSHPQPDQPRNRLSLSRLSLSRSAKHAERAERRHRPPTSSGIAQSSLHHPEDMPYLQRTLSVSEMRMDPSASNENILPDGSHSNLINEKLSGRRKLFNRSSNQSSSSVMDKSHPPPSSSGKARQILRYLDSATGGVGRSSGSSPGYGGAQRDSDLNSIRASNISSDTLASTATSEVRRRSGDSNFASSVAGSIPNWAKRIGKSNKSGAPPSSYNGGFAGSPGAHHYQPATSPLIGPVRPGRGDREVSPAFSDDSSAAAHDGRFQPAPSQLSASTHSGSDSHGTSARGDLPLTPPGQLPPTPSTSFPSSAGPAAVRPASTSGPAITSSASRFSLPLAGGVGFERALRFFIDPDASSNSLGKGGSAADQQGIWLLGVWHGPPSNTDAHDSQPSSLTPLEEPSQSRYSSASPIPVGSKAEQNTSGDVRQSPAASMQRGSMSSQSRGGYPRNSSSEALTSPATSAPSSVSAQSSPEKTHSRLPPPSVSSGSISTRSSIDHASGSYGTYGSRTAGKRATDGSSVEGRPGNKSHPPSASARHARPMSREGSASTASGNESVNRSDRGGFAPERQDSRSSQPLPSPSVNSQTSGARFPQVTGTSSSAAAGSPSAITLTPAEQALRWQADFQADFTSRIWCTYRNHFTPISRDGTISMQAESGPVAIGGGETPVPPPMPGPSGASSLAANSGPGQSVRQWIGRRLGEGGSSQDLLSVSPSYASNTSGGFTSGSPSLSSMHATGSTSNISAMSPGSGPLAGGASAPTYGRSPPTNSGGTGNPFTASIGAGAGFLSATSSVAGGLGEKMGIPGLWGRATAAAQAVGLTGRNGLTTDAGWGCMLRTGQSLLANALMDIHLGREWTRKESPVSTRIAALQQALQQSGVPGATAGHLPLHIAPEAPLLDPNDPDYDAKRQVVEEQWRKAKAEYAKYVQLISWFLDDPCLACPFSVHRMAREGKRLGKEVGEWFGPSTAAGAIKQLVSEFPDAGLGVYVAMDQVVYLAEVKEAAVDARQGQWGRIGAASARWDRPVLILINIRLGIDGVHPRYYDSVKNIFTFPQSVGISGGRPSSSYYFMGCQENTLFYLDPHHVRPAVPYQPPPRSAKRRGSSHSLATEAADSAMLAGDEQEASHADWWCQAYSEAQLNTFHCDKVRKMPMKSLDPSMLLGFLVKTPEQLDDFCARVRKLPEPIFSVADHAPRWDAVEDDEDLDAAMESFSESSLDVNEGKADSQDSEDPDDELDFDTGAVSIPDPISAPVRPTGRSEPPKSKPRTRAAPISTTVAPIQFPSMSSDDFEHGDEDAVDESTTVGHGAREVSRRRSSSARKSQSRRISGLGRRRMQRQSAEGHHMTSTSGGTHSAFGPPGRYGSGISSRQTSGASTAREFSFSMPRGTTAATAAAAAAAAGAGGNSIDISPSASTERGDHSLRSKVGTHSLDRGMNEFTSDTALMTVNEPESSGESGFGEAGRVPGADEINDSGYVVTQAGSMSSDDADSTWSDLSGAQARREQQDPVLEETHANLEEQPPHEAENTDGEEDQILVPAPSSSSSSAYPSTTVDQGSIISEQRYAIVSIDSEDEPEFDAEESEDILDADGEQLDENRMGDTIKGISPSSSTRGSGFLNHSSSSSNSQQHSLYSSVSRNLLPTASSAASLAASQPRRPPVTNMPSSFSAAFGIPADASGSPSSHSPSTLTAAASPIGSSSPVPDESADERSGRFEQHSPAGSTGRLSHSSSYVN